MKKIRRWGYRPITLQTLGKFIHGPTSWNSTTQLAAARALRPLSSQTPASAHPTVVAAAATTEQQLPWVASPLPRLLFLLARFSRSGVALVRMVSSPGQRGGVPPRRSVSAGRGCGPPCADGPPGSGLTTKVSGCQPKCELA